MQSHALDSSEVQQIWQEACSQLKPQLSDAVFSAWILNNPLTQIELQGADKSVATITSPTAFHSSNLKKNLHEKLKTVLDSVIGRDNEILYTVGDPYSGRQAAQTSTFTSTQAVLSTASIDKPPEVASPVITPFSNNFQPPPRKTPQSPRVEDLFSESTIQSASVDRVAMRARHIGLRSDYTFETFAVSSSNEMAHAAATAVSNRPGDSYNPLFLYGGVGVGKTHLMHAIGNNILHNNPDINMVYCTGEEFTNEIINAIRTKKASNFKQKYRSAEVLFIDDIQFIAGKNTVQEEFFHTFNTLIKQAKQVILTSDRPPHEINLLEDRLRSRFEAGLMIDIQQPSFELRTAIFLVKAKAVGIEVPIDLAKLIASKVDSARKIEGIITSIRSEVELKKRTIDENLLEEILRVEVESKRPRIKAKPGDVIRTVANHYRLKQTALKGKSRVKKLVTARHIAMYLMRQELHLPLVEVGRWFSGRDHTSIIHACGKVEKMMIEDSSIQQDVSALRMTLSASS